MRAWFLGSLSLALSETETCLPFPFPSPLFALSYLCEEETALGTTCEEETVLGTFFLCDLASLSPSRCSTILSFQWLHLETNAKV